ncbi:MAG: hypothetical protein HZC51_13310 [Nitrospirae bacterium]|nr:hypothetical protein [Nitrospirota bacterium]
MALAFLVLLLVVIAEITVSAKWNGSYFRYGIPVFKSVIEVHGSDVELPSDESLSGRFRSGIVQSLVFKTISDSEVAFRERGFELTLLTYSPVMHGLVSMSPGRRSIEVKGVLNWFPVAFVLVCYFVFDNGHHVMGNMFMPFILGIVAACYLIQVIRFNRVAEYFRSRYGENSTYRNLAKRETG